MTSITIEVINNKDHEAHSRRVCQYAAILAKEVAKLDASIEPDMIEQAALYHDIGKANIPNEILDKPGRLTDEEFSLIKLPQNMQKPAGLCWMMLEKRCLYGVFFCV